MTITKHESASVQNLPVVAGSTGANLIREAAAVMVDAHALAKAVCSTQMVPKHFQGKPDECAAAMLYGSSLGFDPMQSVRQIYVVHGQAALYARAMDALVKGAGHETWTVATADDSVTVAGRRKGSEHVETSTWDIARATKAGYTRSNDKYKSDPQAMLYSKALSEVCRKIAPDVLNGVYSVEELQMEPWDGTTTPPRETASGRERMGAILGVEQVTPEPSGADTDMASAQAPGSASLVEPESAPEFDGITSAQLKKMGAAMRERGLTERADALAFVAETIGREVSSRNDLSKDEASAVIDALEQPWPAEDPS